MNQACQENTYLKKPHPDNRLILNNPKACRAAFHSLPQQNLIIQSTQCILVVQRNEEMEKKKEKKQEKMEKDIYASGICYSLGLRKSQHPGTVLTKSPQILLSLAICFKKLSLTLTNTAPKFLNKIGPKTIHPLFHVSYIAMCQNYVSQFFLHKDLPGRQANLICTCFMDA